MKEFLLIIILIFDGRNDYHLERGINIFFRRVNPILEGESLNSLIEEGLVEKKLALQMNEYKVTKEGRAYITDYLMSNDIDSLLELLDRNWNLFSGMIKKWMNKMK